MAVHLCSRGFFRLQTSCGIDDFARRATYRRDQRIRGAETRADVSECVDTFGKRATVCYENGPETGNAAEGAGGTGIKQECPDVVGT